jgi:hypothetical protein
VNRRALLSAFLAAPVAVKLAPFVKPAPMVYTVTLGGNRCITAPSWPADGRLLIVSSNSRPVSWSAYVHRGF